MNDIENRIELAKADKRSLDSLLTDYMPFIKKQAYSASLGLERDDMLSIALLTFSGCVAQYDRSKGSFFAFATTSIRNRLIDESRRQGRHTNRVVPLFAEDGTTPPSVEAVSMQQYSMTTQQQTLREEIDALSTELLTFGITFAELPQISPKQDRARALCQGAVMVVLADADMKNQLLSTKKLAQSQLASKLYVSAKTIEKHRRYIVTLAVIMSGDYPNIKAFLPQHKEVR